MKKKIILPILLLTAAFLRAQTFTTYPNDPIHLKKTTLSNGLDVFLVEDHNQPMVFGMVVVKAGGKYDPKDATGMGHYLEHMLFKGTQKLGTRDYAMEKPFLDRIDSLYEVLGKTIDGDARKEVQKKINENAVAAAEFAIPNELDRLLGSIGGKGVNAFTQEEMIAYHNVFPPNQVEKWLDIYAERFDKPVFRLFQSELETVYEEKNRAMDGFEYKIFREFSKSFFKNHPYGTQDVLGETEHLKNPSLTKMYQYYNTYYVANNMALVLSGDFDADAVLPIIQKKFGGMRSGIVPKFPEYPEAPFKGREYISGNYTPIKVGLLGFRTVPNGHPDLPTLEIVNHLLFNNAETGLLNKLAFDQKLMGCFLQPMTYNDHGAALLIVIPKLVGQSMKAAEAISLAEIAKIGRGEFDDVTFNAAKLTLKLEFQRSLENSVSRGIFVAENFTQNRPWGDFVAYPNQINAVTKEQVIAAAQKYYGPNYLILESKMGFPKKEKLEKPGYIAPKPPVDAKSEYAKAFEQLPEGKPLPRFMDFNTDIQQMQIADNVRLLLADNPLNDIFEMKLRFNKGLLADPMMETAAEFMSVSGTESKTTDELKRAFELLGCTYSITAENNFLDLELNGIEENLSQALYLLAELCLHPKADPKKVDLIYKNAKTDRKVENRETAQIGTMTVEYVLFGKQSQYVSRPSLKTIQSATAPDLVSRFQSALNAGCEIYYSGKKKGQDVSEALKTSFFQGRYPNSAIACQEQIRTQYHEPTVFFLKRSDAIQTQIYFFHEGMQFDPSSVWKIDAFNEYFGGSMAGLVFQEIREFRSLAYTAYANIRQPALSNGRNIMRGFIGCQADKTTEAMEVMNSLLTDMPQKADRIESIRRAVMQASAMARPDFRNICSAIAAYQRKGYTTDPMRQSTAQYSGITWENVYDYYKSTWQIADPERPIVWVLTGDPKRFNLEALKKYGKIIELEEKTVRTE